MVGKDRGPVGAEGKDGGASHDHADEWKELKGDTLWSCPAFTDG